MHVRFPLNRNRFMVEQMSLRIMLEGQLMGGWIRAGFGRCHKPHLTHTPTSGDEETYESCPICFEVMERRQMVGTPCGHRFCAGCIAELKQVGDCAVGHRACVGPPFLRSTRALTPTTHTLTLARSRLVRAFAVAAAFVLVHRSPLSPRGHATLAWP